MKKRETKALKPSEMGLHSRTRYVIMLKSWILSTFAL